MMIAQSGILEQLPSLWDQARSIWFKGGWAMWAIAAIALIMFAIGIHIAMRLSEKRFLTVPEKTWRRWIDRPAERQGPIGNLLHFVTRASSVEEMVALFERVRTTEAAPFERDLRLMKICVSAAPLLGLLGTVTGMLATFNALATGSGGDKTMGLVAAGISEALVTTMTGLVIALPGLFFRYQLGRKFERYKAFLAHLETVCTQARYRETREESRRAGQRRAAGEIARTLFEKGRSLVAGASAAGSARGSDQLEKLEAVR